MNFSIVTLSFNQAQYLPFAMESVFAQRDTGLRVEYIVVDPGSSDGSRAVAESVKDRIDHLIFEPDRGPADGLNKGFARSTGDILGFLNADDCLEPRALARVGAYFDGHPDIDVVSGALRIIDEHGTPLHRLRVPGTFSADRFVLGLAVPHQQSTFFRRSAWTLTDGFAVDNRTSWDAELFVDMSLAGARFGTMNAILAQFRSHPGSITARAGQPISSGDEDLVSRMDADARRLTEKVLMATGTTPSARSNSVRRLAYRLRPTRRFREITHLGLRD